MAGLKQGIGRSKVKVVAAQPFEVTDPDVQSQISRLKASGANVLALFATPRHAIQGYVFANRLGWRPLIINNAVSSASNIMLLAAEGGSNKAVENSVSIVFLKDPTDPKWRNDAAVKLYRSIMSRFAKGANQKDVYHVYGMAVAYEFVKVLKAAGKNPTRASVMAQTRKLNDPSNPFLLPGADDQDERDRSASRSSRRCSSAGRRGAGRASAGSGATERDRSHGCAARRAARRPARGGARAAARRRARHLLAEGLHPADDALPRRLRLLHVRPAAAARRAGVPDARRGAGDRPRRRAAGCTEALFTLGDKPELRYKVARAELAELGCETTLEYLGRVAKLVLDETGLLPHLNPGVMTRRSWPRSGRSRPRWGSCSRRSRSGSPRRAARTGPRRTSCRSGGWGRSSSPGELRIPFTSGILIGIGETRAERLEALEALRRLHERHGHLQEVIVQNFRAKPGTRMASHPEPSLDDHLWTIAAARLLLPDDVAVQAPPNLAYDDFPRLLDAGIDDWGGVSPVTIDHVNPEAPWPERDRPRAATRSRGSSSRRAAARLPALPLRRVGRPAVLPAALRASDSLGLAREDGWHPGEAGPSPSSSPATRCRWTRAGELGEEELVRLFRARGDERQRVFAAADRLRRGGLRRRGQLRRHAEHPVHERLLLPLRLLRLLEGEARGEPPRRAVPRPARGDRPPRARGVGPRRDRGLPPGRDPPGLHGRVLRLGRGRDPGALPDLHIHAFSALEVWQGAATLGLPLEEYLELLRSLGLGSLPGTAAEILDDEVRRGDLPRQGLDRAVARGARGRAPRRPPLERDDHVRARRAARALGAAPPAGARAAGAVGRVHRVRAAAVRAHGGADVAAGPRALGADVRRVAAHARGRAARAPPGDHEHPGVVGEARPRGRRGRAPGRRQRPRRDADERVDLPLGGLGARAGAAARGDGGADPRERPDAAASGRRSTATRRPSAAPPRSRRRRSRSRSTRRSATPA